MTKAGINVDDFFEKANIDLPEIKEIGELPQATSAKITDEERSEQVKIISNNDREDINYNKPPSKEDISRQNFDFLLKGAQEERFPIVLFQISRAFCIIQFKLGLILEKNARTRKKNEGGLTHEQIIQRLKEIASYIRVANVIISSVKNNTNILPISSSSSQKLQEVEESVPTLPDQSEAKSFDVHGKGKFEKQ